MIVSISQPAYLPWLGYFHRIAVSDLHIVLDHVQLEKSGFTKRNRILTAQGPLMLTVPVRTKGRFGNLRIQDVEIQDGTPWRTKHWRTILRSYGRAPYFADHAGFLESTYRREWRHLSDLCAELTAYLLTALDIRTPVQRSSEMHPTGAKSEVILSLCLEAGARTYLSGPLGRDYLDAEAFARAGIAVVYQDYRHPRYPQGRGGFESHLSVIDLLFNCGPRSREVLLEGQDALGGEGMMVRHG